MKIAPEPPRPTPERPAPPGGEPARPFTDFLAEPESRAARFTELGMFGLSRASAAPSPGGGDAAPPVGPAQPEEVPSPAARSTAPVTVSETPAVQAPLDSPGPVTCELPLPTSAKAETDRTCTLPGEAPGHRQEADGDFGPEGPTRTSRARPRRPAPRAGVSLTVREADGAIEIIAGAPPIDPETRAQLRRLIEAILARNGLALAQFQLNGAPLAPDLSGRRGGIHGTGTR